MKKKVLYIGGFEMPDKNAAAQRVLSIGKVLRGCGYDVKFYGVTNTEDILGIVDNFVYEAVPHPNSLLKWISYAIGIGMIDYIKKDRPDYIITYNYPAIAQERVIRYAKRHGIKVIGDITEWYRATSTPKRVDTWLRMRFSNFHLDGIISISNFLSDFYKKKNIVQLPPFVDKTEDKWRNTVPQIEDDKIRLVYIGTGSIKDRLDIIIKNIKKSNSNRFILDIIGITEDQFHNIYQSDIDFQVIPYIHFHGRMPHLQAIEYLKKADFQIFFRDNIRVNNAGFPTKLVESFSAGIPVITNKISNISDYIIDGKNSFMIDDLNEESIERVLCKVSLLTKEEIAEIKTNIDVNEFDFHNFIDPLRNFMDGI